MQFVPSPSPTFFAPAVLPRLAEDGALDEFKFDCKFKRLTSTQYNELDAKVAAQRDKLGKPAKKGEAKPESVDRMVMREVCAGWRISKPAASEGAKPESEEIAFTVEVLDALEEENPGFAGYCVRAFYLSMTPTKSAHYAEKNS